MYMRRWTLIPSLRTVWKTPAPVTMVETVSASVRLWLPTHRPVMKPGSVWLGGPQIYVVSTWELWRSVFFRLYFQSSAKPPFRSKPATILQLWWMIVMNSENRVFLSSLSNTVWSLLWGWGHIIMLTAYLMYTVHRVHLQSEPVYIYTLYSITCWDDLSLKLVEVGNCQTSKWKPIKWQQQSWFKSSLLQRLSVFCPKWLLQRHTVWIRGYFFKAVQSLLLGWLANGE